MPLISGPEPGLLLVTPQMTTNTRAAKINQYLGATKRNRSRVPAISTYTITIAENISGRNLNSSGNLNCCTRKSDSVTQQIMAIAKACIENVSAIYE